MPFSPRLPTWQMSFTPYLPNPGSDTYSIDPPFTGQLYTLKRVAEVLGYESMYAVFPKSVLSVINPQDVTEFAGEPRWQYLRHEWNGRDWLWAVNQLVPRWANFPNEHWLALISQMSAEDAAIIYSKSGAAAGDSADVDFGSAANGTCTACGSLPATVSCTIPTFYGAQSAPFAFACSPSGQAYWTWGYTPDDPSGPSVFAFLNDPLGANFCAYSGDATGWDEASPITLNALSHGSPAMCVWPASVVVTPT